MKILQISNYYFPHIGGVEQVARDISGAIEDYEQKIFCFNHESGDKKDEVDGVEVIRAGCFAKIASQSLSFSYKKLLKSTFKSFNPDVVIFHYPNPFGARYLLKILKKFPDCKLVLYWHLDITKQKILGKFFHKQNLKLLDRAVRIVATSPNYIEGSKYLCDYTEKCKVIPCCVTDERVNVTEDVESGAEAVRRDNKDKIVCFAIGRHVPYKGMEYLVRAARLLDDRFSVYIGGAGELTEDLKRLAEGDKKITFLGRMSDGDLKAYLKAADIFCFPSITKNEAFGIALAEAMAYGKPCVTFRIDGSGVNYVSLNGVTGIEVENRNVSQFAEAMLTLAENPDLRKMYGEAAVTRERELFTETAFAKNIQKMLEEI